MYEYYVQYAARTDVGERDERNTPEQAKRHVRGGERTNAKNASVSRAKGGAKEKDAAATHACRKECSSTTDCTLSLSGQAKHPKYWYTLRSVELVSRLLGCLPSRPLTICPRTALAVTLKRL